MENLRVVNSAYRTPCSQEQLGLTNLTKLANRHTIEGKGIAMLANSSELPEAEETALEPEPLRNSGQNLLRITYIADDFDATLPEDVLQDFGL